VRRTLRVSEFVRASRTSKGMESIVMASMVGQIHLLYSTDKNNAIKLKRLSSKGLKPATDIIIIITYASE